MHEITFKHIDPLSDGEITLELEDTLQGHRALERVPAYKFSIVRNIDGAKVGDIDIRIGITENLYLYGGQVGYGISPLFRGNYYAAKACLLISKVALLHEMDELWITCNHDNLASRKTCEAIGAQLVEKVNVPKSNELYARGDRVKCRYYWNLRTLNNEGSLVE